MFVYFNTERLGHGFIRAAVLLDQCNTLLSNKATNRIKEETTTTVKAGTTVFEIQSRAGSILEAIVLLMTIIICMPAGFKNQ